MRSDNRKRRDPANPDKPKQRPREHRQMGFLCDLTQGESIKDACALVGSPASRTSNRTTAKGGSRAPAANQQPGQSGQSGHPQSAEKPTQNQQDTGIKASTGAVWNFSEIRTKRIRAKRVPARIHSWVQRSETRYSTGAKSSVRR